MPYSCRLATANEEIIGEWLNENTITGIANHNVVIKLLPVPPPWMAVSKIAVVQLGIKYNPNNINAATNGNTRMLIALTIMVLPRRTIVINPRISTRDNMALGGAF